MAWGCEVPASSAVEDGVPDDEGNKVEYMSCPMLFVSDVIWEFIKLNRFIKPPTTERGFYNRRPRFANFQDYYESKVREYQEIKDMAKGV